MQDLKTGHLIRASPRAQFYGQIIGSCLSIVVTATAYTLYTRAYQIPGPSFPAPTAFIWLGLARLLRMFLVDLSSFSYSSFIGDGDLPPRSDIFMISFGLFFGVVSAIKTYSAQRQRWFAKWIPSGVAFAIGFLNTPSFTLARLIGGFVEYLYHRKIGKENGGIRLIVIASGFVLGEGVISIVSLILRTYGIGVISCWGCGHGLCGGCPQ